MFIFDCTRIISYKDYNCFISSLKTEFDTQKSYLFDSYNITKGTIPPNQECYFEFRDKYRNLRQNIIKTVLRKFRSYLPLNCLIYEFGSLTKHTDRIESDTDLTICYDEDKKILFENAEELINYSIVRIFEHSIDHIHGKFQHYPINHKYDHLTDKDNLYVLKFDTGSIEYKCGQETLCENIMSIKNVRNYAALIEGYEEKYRLRCNIDCLYSVNILENTTQHDFLNDLAKLEINNNIFQGYKYRYSCYSVGECVEISYIKKAFKDTIVSMYIMISYLRKKVDWLSEYSMNMDDVFGSNVLRSYWGDTYINDLKKCFINMIFYWDKIELMLKKKSVPLSTRCHAILSDQKLNDMLYNEYNVVNMMDFIIKSINDLNDVISRGWSLINNSHD